MKHSETFLRKRKFFMALPLLVLPFVTLLFWALGGGQGSQAEAMTVRTEGLNFELPDAQFDEKEIWDKLSLYEMAERDSAKFEEARESDPYFDLVTFQESKGGEPQTDLDNQSKLIDSFPHKDKLAIDPNEEKVNRKLEELYKEINRPGLSTATTPTSTYALEPPADPLLSSDVEKLEQMMEMMHESNASDPEMQQIENVLDKILDIQYPERAKEKLKSQGIANKQQTFQVQSISDTDHISLISNKKVEPVNASEDTFPENAATPIYAARQNAFYGLDDEITAENQFGNSIEAVIHDTQELVAGSTVKMRLLNEVEINGKRIQKDQFIYGVCAINGERLTIEIGSIRTGNFLLPVSMSAYDLDGLEGIYIPGAITRDAAKQASDDAMQNIQMMSLDPSLAAQAATAGIEATKGLLSKKAKLVKVTVKAGYKILLKDTNSSNNY
jgi:conjugative transposon TraM protein